MEVGFGGGKVPQHIVDFYIRLAPQMFHVPFRYKWKTFGGFTGPLIPEENHEKAFGNSVCIGNSVCLGSTE